MISDLQPLSPKQVSKQILGVALGLAILLSVVGLVFAATTRVVAIESSAARIFAGVMDVVLGTGLLLLAIFLAVRTFVFLTSKPE